MLLLPRREPLILPPVPLREWRVPSRSVPRDQFGNVCVQTRFRIAGRLHNGHTKFRLWFDSRDDADQFLWALGQYLTGGTPIPREDWGLVDEIWGDPELYPELAYDFATVTFLATTGSNQTYNKPSDWNDGNNSVEGLGGGASGGLRAAGSGSRKGTGGGGGAYSRIVNFVFPGGSVTYRVGSGGTGVTRGSDGGTAGNPGTVTYFNAASDPGAGSDNTKLGARPGSAGSEATGPDANGGAGGLDTSGWGSTRRSGGRGGNCVGSGSGSWATGGGGAAGTIGTGGDGGDLVAAGQSAGGSANGGTTAGGSAGVSTQAPSGTEWDGSHGSGAGSGGNFNSNQASGNGGNYGGGTGGDSGTSSGNPTSGNGSQGLLVVTYTPALSSFMLMFH